MFGAAQNIATCGDQAKIAYALKLGTIAAALEAQVWPKFETTPDALRPHIHATFPLAEVAKAHQMMEAGTHFGKIVLTI